MFATATVLAFVLLRNSNFNFHCYTQREATPTQKSARKCAATSRDFFRERLQSAFTLANQLRWIAQYACLLTHTYPDAEPLSPFSTHTHFIVIMIIHSFYIVLFAALEQTHCAQGHVILNEWLYPFTARIINIYGSGVLTALFGCCIAGATWNAAVSAQVLCTPFNHAPGYSVTSFKAT